MKVVIALIAFVIGFSVGANDGYDNGFNVAHKNMLKNCFDDRYVRVTVDKVEYLFQCNDKMGHSTIERR